MCAEKRIILWFFFEDGKRKEEALHMHASVHIPKVSACAFSLLSYPTRGKGDHLGQDKATSRPWFVVLSEYSSFCSFLRNRVSTFQYGMWYLPRGSLYKTSHQGRTHSGGWCSGEPMREAISTESEAETDISQSVCSTWFGCVACVCSLGLQFASFCLFV